MKKTIGLAAAIALALSATPALAAKFYKWTDADGVTHYSADPPPATAKASEVKVRTRRTADDAEPAADAPEASAGLPTGTAPATGGAQAKSKEPAKPEEAATQGKKPEAGKERYAEKCKQLRSNLQAMEEHGRVKESDDKGNVRVLTDEEKNDRLDATQRQIKAFCE